MGTIRGVFMGRVDEPTGRPAPCLSLPAMAPALLFFLGTPFLTVGVKSKKGGLTLLVLISLYTNLIYA
jgi:hypothetical protein